MKLNYVKRDKYLFLVQHMHIFTVFMTKIHNVKKLVLSYEHLRELVITSLTAHQSIKKLTNQWKLRKRLQTNNFKTNLNETIIIM